MAQSDVPKLKGDAKRAVKHRGSHLQIIASAGSGKTEVVSQRVAGLLADGAEPRSIVAFTFTEKAAAELKERISQRVEARLGPSSLDRLSGLYVGTIHAYCFRLLQEIVPRYETFDVLDDNQLTAFLSREANRLDIASLDSRGGRFAAIKSFLKNLDVVENELLDPQTMPEPFRTVLGAYFDTLERYRVLTYGQQISRTVQELGDPANAEKVHATLRHLIVDEYQDVNPAQERLVELLAGPEVELCVVGDDDQAIYQWRGSDVANIVDFADRYDNVATFEITTNRRSRPGIIKVANRFARTIPNRIDKRMDPDRKSKGSAPEVALWTAEDQAAESGWIASMILDLNESGVPFRDIAVLVRGKASYPSLLEHFATFGIPVQPGGRTGLFDQPEARALGKAVCWLTDLDWRDSYQPAESLDREGIAEDLLRAFNLGRRRLREIHRLLDDWHAKARQEDRPADLLGDFYSIVETFDVRGWDISEPIEANRMGTLARFSALLADYESVRRRARPDSDTPGEQVGGEDRGYWYYRGLGTHIINYANGAFEGFDGEADLGLDAIELTTIHRAKGLEWPVVFVPSMTKGRFPSRFTGREANWLVPREMFSADRYEGSDGDERRLFYVATTRARDFLSVSRHEKVTRQRVQPSPYFEDLSHLEVDPEEVEYPPVKVSPVRNVGHVSVTYSELAQFLECGQAYRLRTLLGFQPKLAPELGYGKAVHHVLRTVAIRTAETGSAPSPADIDQILHDDFFLPAANKPAHRQMKEAARRLVNTYVSDFESDLHRVWETERPFELHLEGITVSGRADVILDREDGVAQSLAILDYKTASDRTEANDLQLQVYVSAGRREGLEVPAAYVHNLGATDAASARSSVAVDPSEIEQAETKVVEAGDKLRNRRFVASPERQKCARCDVRAACSSRQ